MPEQQDRTVGLVCHVPQGRRRTELPTQAARTVCRIRARWKAARLQSIVNVMLAQQDQTQVHARCAKLANSRMYKECRIVPTVDLASTQPQAASIVHFALKMLCLLHGARPLLIASAWLDSRAPTAMPA